MPGLTTTIANNNLKSGLLLAAFPALLLTLLAAMVWALGFMAQPPGGGPIDPTLFQSLQLSLPDDGALTPAALTASAVRSWWPWVLGVAAVWLVIGYLFNSVMIRAATGAKPLQRRDAPELYNLLENLCISRGMAMPQLHLIDSDALNAFASGIDRRSYAVTVTRGLLQTLDREELEAVLGHELTHIRNHDVRLLIVTIVFVGMISFIAEMIWRNIRLLSYGGNRDRKGGMAAFVLVAALIAGIGYLLALVLRFAISRKREFLADAGAVELTKNPDAMIRALEKISGNARLPHVPAEVKQLFIENPPELGLVSLFATHPPIEARIAALRQLGGLRDEGQSIIPRVG
jgi:heat shock protein HtpX